MKYKEFELILSSFKCNKNCPYCTAKITKWPVVDDKLELLAEKLYFLKSKGINAIWVDFIPSSPEDIPPGVDFMFLLTNNSNKR